MIRRSPKAGMPTNSHQPNGLVPGSRVSTHSCIIASACWADAKRSASIDGGPKCGRPVKRARLTSEVNTATSGRRSRNCLRCVMGFAFPFRVSSRPSAVAGSGRPPNQGSIHGSTSRTRAANPAQSQPRAGSAGSRTDRQRSAPVPRGPPGLRRFGPTLHPPASTNEDDARSKIHLSATACHHRRVGSRRCLGGLLVAFAVMFRFSFQSGWARFVCGSNAVVAPIVGFSEPPYPVGCVCQSSWSPPAPVGLREPAVELVSPASISAATFSALSALRTARRNRRLRAWSHTTRCCD